MSREMSPRADMEEPKTKLKVYCETSFWSFLNGRPTPVAHVALKQAATLQWWQDIAPTCDIFVSQYVGDEAEEGNAEFARKRIRSMEAFPLLDVSVPAISVLAMSLIAAHAVPPDETTDAYHIATAAVHGMDVLLTWNCRHMANPVTLPKTSAIVTKAGFTCPVIITPADFIERKGEFGYVL